MRSEKDQKLKQNEFTKANIKKETKKILNRIVAEEEKFEYQVLEDLLKEKYPKYFRKMTV